MLSVCAGSVKRFGVVETLAKKQAGVEKSLFLNQTKVHGMGCGATRAAFGDGPSQGKETTSDGSASTANPGPCSTKQEQDTLTVTTPASSVYAQTVTTPSSALAEATKESVALARRAHDFAAAKYLRLGQESQKRPTEGLLTRCRLAGETLTKATLELQSLSTESERALVSVRISHPPHSASLIAHTRLTLFRSQSGGRGAGSARRRADFHGNEKERKGGRACYEETRRGSRVVFAQC